MKRTRTLTLVSLGLVCAGFGMACGSGETATFTGSAGGFAGIGGAAGAGGYSGSGGSGGTGGTGGSGGSSGDGGTAGSDGGRKDASTDARDATPEAETKDDGDTAEDANADSTEAGGGDSDSDDAANDGNETGGGGAAGDDAGDSGAGGMADAADSGAGGAGGADAGQGGSGGSGGADAGKDSGSGGTGGSGGSGCNFNGTWGSKIDINVTWAATLALSAGNGKITQWIKSSRVQNGKTVTDTAVVCDIALPDFSNSSLAALVFGQSETYGVRFPNTLFDNDYLPTFTINGTVTSNAIGASYSSSATAVLLGMTMTSASTAAWPAASAIVQADRDQDNKPGVTANAAATNAGPAYSQFPINLGSPPARADKLYLAIRQVTSISGSFTTCDKLTGSVAIPTLGGKAAIDSHVIGCHVSGTNNDCTTTGTGGGVNTTGQAGFVDDSSPVFTPGATKTVVSVRMQDGATCADVRGLTF